MKYPKVIELFKFHDFAICNIHRGCVISAVLRRVLFDATEYGSFISSLESVS